METFNSSVAFLISEDYVTVDNCLKFNDSLLNENLIMKIVILGLFLLIIILIFRKR